MHLLEYPPIIIFIDWIANPYLHEGEKSLNMFDINVHIHAGLPIRDITCETHKTDINYEGRNIADVQLDNGGKQDGNRDFILKYRLAGDKIEIDALLYEGDGEKLFLMMMQPPKRVKASQIPPREYLFVVDVSGSMRGFPLNTSKVLLKNLIGSLNKEDMFNVLLFAGSATAIASLEQNKAPIPTATPAKDKPAKPDAVIKPCIKIGGITVTGDITQADVRKQLEALLDDIGKCYQKTFGNCSQCNRSLPLFLG